MNLIINRIQYRPDGIFSECLDENRNFKWVLLEHAYLQDDGSYKPKVLGGVYHCERGDHQLEGMTEPFQTFEVMNVPGHTNILFHKGNYNEDSAGCFLIGKSMGNMLNGGKMICSSKQAFDEFMLAQKECDSFTITVVDSKA